VLNPETGYVVQIRGSATDLYRLHHMIQGGADIRNEPDTDEVNDRVMTVRVPGSIAICGHSITNVKHGHEVPEILAEDLLSGEYQS